MRTLDNSSPISIDGCDRDAIILVTCTVHTYWSAMRFHEDEAVEVACRHEKALHPQEFTYRNLRTLRTRRRVARDR